MTVMHNDCNCGDLEDCGCADPVKITGHVTGTMRVNPEAADYGSYTSFSFTGSGTDAPVQILGRDNDRTRVLVWVIGGAGVYLGKLEQINQPNNGVLLTATMQPVEIRNKQALWAVGTVGTACVVYVVNERWDSARTD
jgi:hypothetical protein